ASSSFYFFFSSRRRHTRCLSDWSSDVCSSDLPAPTSADEVGKRHRGIAGGGNLRAAVFGINDGLVSNASLILGVAGASANNSTILLSRIAGPLAGATSMAAGDYVSGRSQRDRYEQ